MNCYNCDQTSGTSYLCKLCIKDRKNHAKTWKYINRTKEKAVICFHCHMAYPPEMLCFDHFPYSRGARPDLKFDDKNLVTSCMDCNRSDNPNRF